MRTLGLAIVAFSLAPPVCAAGPREVCVASVPDSIEPKQLSPNGETNELRYATAFRSYCWNCLSVRAQDLDAACPTMCSGNDAATRGCADGARVAAGNVDALIRKYGRQRARKRLRALASEAEAHHKLEPYFKDGPAKAQK